MTHYYKLLIAYDGTNYSGWQVQPNALTIQEVIERTIATILNQKITLTGSGRTDAGVHALGQVAHFHCENPLNIYRFQFSLNRLLPKDIRILEMTDIHPHFHAQFHATGKTYYYHLQLGPTQNPFKRLYSLHVREPLDLSKLKEATQFFIGTHDFTSFANQAHMGAAGKNPVRTVKRIDVVEESGGIRLEFEADGFLYKMVRNLTGTLLAVAKNTLHIDQIPIILAAKNRSCTAKAAPPEGLFLIHVDYPESFQKIENGEPHSPAAEEFLDN